MKKVLTIAGSDCSGGAGIQADIKTIAVHGLYAMSVITALTAQNTTGVSGVLGVDPDFVGRQLDCVFTDIPPDAVKIGMVFSADIIEAVAGRLERYGAKNVVVDPVMVATSGDSLLNEDAVRTLIRRLFPLAAVITPNLPEAAKISGLPVRTKNEMEQAGRKIARSRRCAVLLKGGHLTDGADDLLVSPDGRETWFPSRRVDTRNTHGTGCTLSSAIACGLAAGKSLEQSVRDAKDYLTGALLDGLNLGKGSGPVNHTYRIK